MILHLLTQPISNLPLYRLLGELVTTTRLDEQFVISRGCCEQIL
jgi:hypothetical protein